jgi:hypothetical protein
MTLAGTRTSPHIRSMTYHRVLLFGAILIVALGAGCQRNQPRVESVPIDPDAPPFVGWIKGTHGPMLALDEDAPKNVRRAEVFISPTTEIVMRNGMLWPAHWLRPGLRVTVWFTGNGSEAAGIVRATAQKVLVDQ